MNYLLRYIYMIGIAEPVVAGIVVALFNTYIINNFNPFILCSEAVVEPHHGDGSSTTTMNSDINHIHIHHANFLYI